MMSEVNAKPQRRLPWLRLLFVTCAILVLVPCLCLAGGVAYYNAQRRGASSRWRSLGAPPGSGVEILTGDTDVVYVRAAAGDIYGCRHKRRITNGSCWVAAQEQLDIHPNTSFDALLFRDEVELPPGTPVDALQVTTYERTSSHEARYVLLQDGTVWKWEYSQYANFALLIPVLGLIAGGVLAIALVVVLWSGVGVRSLWQRISRKSPGIDG